MSTAHCTSRHPIQIRYFRSFHVQLKMGLCLILSFFQCTLCHNLFLRWSHLSTTKSCLPCVISLDLQCTYNKGPTSAPCCSFLTDRLNLLRLFMNHDMISKKQIRSRKGRDPSRRDGLSGEPEAGWAVQDFISTSKGQESQ